MASGPKVKQIDIQTNGAIIIRNGLGKTVELPPGTNGQVLTIVSGVPAYQTPVSVDPRDIWRYSLLHQT